MIWYDATDVHTLVFVSLSPTLNRDSEGCKYSKKFPGSPWKFVHQWIVAIIILFSFDVRVEQSFKMNSAVFYFILLFEDLGHNWYFPLFGYFIEYRKDFSRTYQFFHPGKVFEYQLIFFIEIGLLKIVLFQINFAKFHFLSSLDALPQFANLFV